MRACPSAGHSLVSAAVLHRLARRRLLRWLLAPLGSHPGAQQSLSTLPSALFMLTRMADSVQHRFSRCISNLSRPNAFAGRQIRGIELYCPLTWELGRTFVGRQPR